MDHISVPLNMQIELCKKIYYGPHLIEGYPIQIAIDPPLIIGSSSMFEK